MLRSLFRNIVIICLGSSLLLACSESDAPLFTLIDADQSGLKFSNDLSFDAKFNVYKYRNFYNGGGVSVGDINGDDLPDLYLTANQKPNRLFLNKGELKFEDITETSGVAGTRAWSTGVTMVDVNSDGLLDIYVCNSGDVAGDNKQNELFINNGDLTFTEAAEQYGLADQGFSTHASFFDYDRDGDLDAYILNNSYQSIGSFNLKKNERPKRDQLGGDKLMRNDGGKFVDVSEEAGIYGSIIGFGLGVTVGDANGDTWDDIYVSNDFFERDYLYINNQDGTFTEELTEQIKSTSGASMGADMADMNNDGLNDIFVTEMLPRDYERLKSVTTFEDWNRYQYSVSNDYYHQFTRNTFQVNNGNGTFHEVSRMSGIDATDWSWGALCFDMDNDGYRDLYVANGIYQDLTDQDYIQYISSQEVAKTIITESGVDYKKLIEIIPSNPISNIAFHNNGDLTFDEQTRAMGLEDPGFSNGAVYADLDRDGDLDLVVNNVNNPAWLYKNNATESKLGNYLQFKLKGTNTNPFAIGAKISIKEGANIYYVEQQPSRGFQSSMEPLPHVGLKSNTPVALTVVWPDGRITEMNGVSVNQVISLDIAGSKYPKAVTEPNTVPTFVKLENDISFLHSENEYNDFDRDRMIYHVNSRTGPKMSITDVDQDGEIDLFVSGAKGFTSGILKKTDAHYHIDSTSFIKEAISEDTESLFFDLEGDGDMDLYVCSGGVEFSKNSSAYIDRLYVNDGLGNFKRKSNTLLPSTKEFLNSSTVAGADIDGDGDTDLFVGEFIKPQKYGVAGSGFILINDDGNLIESTEKIVPSLKEIGMITDALFDDIDADGDADLIVVGEFMAVSIFENTKGQFTLINNAQLDGLKGWWNTIDAVDIDGDGDKDYVIGNHGTNSRFKASKDLPISLFVSDFDKNGTIDPIICKYHEDGKAYPYALRHNLIDQIKSLKKRFLDYDSFKNASISEIFDKDQLDEAKELQVNILSTVILKNLGNMNFEVVELPQEVQRTPVFALSHGDYDHDGDVDILMGGNLYYAKPEVGRYDASYGSFLINDGHGNFEHASSNLGFVVDGEIRDIITLSDKVVVGRNNNSSVVFQY